MNVDDFYILIPARKGSKGFPFKNRELFKYTADIIPDNIKSITYVSTDDPDIVDKARSKNINVINRPKELSRDTTSMKDVLKNFIETKNIKKDKKIILLYLTYPERTWEDVEQIYEKFTTTKSKSLVCCEKIKEHPYLCLQREQGGTAKLLIDHKLYRRQDYPECVRLSMFVSCYTVGSIENLHDLMFDDTTYFYQLRSHKVDVDYIDQFLGIPK